MAKLFVLLRTRLKTVVERICSQSCRPTQRLDWRNTCSAMFIRCAAMDAAVVPCYSTCESAHSRYLNELNVAADAEKMMIAVVVLDVKNKHIAFHHHVQLFSMLAVAGCSLESASSFFCVTVHESACSI